MSTGDVKQSGGSNILKNEGVQEIWQIVRGEQLIGHGGG